MKRMGVLIKASAFQGAGWQPLREEKIIGTGVPPGKLPVTGKVIRYCSSSIIVYLGLRCP